jgi:hypothetical protein
MKTWQEFNDAVIELLLTDGARRGLGVEKYRDRMIVAGVRDLQRHIPELRTTPSTLGWTSSGLTTHSEGKCEVGDFNYEGTRVLDIVVRRLPTEENSQSASVYYRPSVLPGYKYYDIIDGGGRERSQGYPGRISFRLGKFYSSPALREDEALTILFNSEKVYLPLNLCVGVNADEATKLTPLTDDAALAVHHFVKYHFAKDIDDNQKLASSNFDLFKNIRRSIFANKQETPATADATIPVIGDGVIP